MKITYVADDGKVFDSKDKCAEYETGKTKELKEKESRWKQVEQAYKNYIDAEKIYHDLKNKFEEDYDEDEDVRYSDISELLKFLFS